MTSYVEYDSNNSGGHWWLDDEDWFALERAGWKVVWAKLTHAYTEDGGYQYDDDGTPKLIPVETSDNKFAMLGVREDGRYLGAMAKRAYRPGATSLRECAEDWEAVTGKSSTEAGCACCGQPHRFTLYIDGKWTASGPETSYTAQWA